MRLSLAIVILLFCLPARADVSVWEYNQLVDKYNSLRSEYNELVDDYNAVRKKYNNLIDEYNEDTQSLYATICQDKDKIYKNTRTILSDLQRRLPRPSDDNYKALVRAFNFQSAESSLAAIEDILDVSTSLETCNDEGKNTELNKRRKETLQSIMVNISSRMVIMERMLGA